MDNTNAERIATVKKLRHTMRLAYEGGQLALAKATFQEIVLINCTYFDALARASKLPRTMPDADVTQLVRSRAKNRGH